MKVEKEWSPFFHHFILYAFEKFKANEIWEGQHSLKDIFTKDMESFLKPQSIEKESDLISFWRSLLVTSLCTFPLRGMFSLFLYGAKIDKGLKEL